RHQLPEILTLEEVIAKFGKKLHLMIEVKENLKYAPNKVKSLETLLSPLTPQSDYHLLSLTPEYLEPLFFAPKKALLDVIWLNPKDIFRENKKLGHGAIAGHFLFFTTPQISDLKAQGKKIGAGFLNSRNSLYREVNRGIDYIFTDHPLTLKQYIP
ncbi:MAG: hypothetical protein KDD38_10400, partial [Bdellovibrionales bacterium]|nr:hypothetical protein [Bdellovibrionales bacterium]